MIYFNKRSFLLISIDWYWSQAISVTVRPLFWLPRWSAPPSILHPSPTWFLLCCWFWVREGCNIQCGQNITEARTQWSTDYIDVVLGPHTWRSWSMPEKAACRYCNSSLGHLNLKVKAFKAEWFDILRHLFQHNYRVGLVVCNMVWLKLI